MKNLFIISILSLIIFYTESASAVPVFELRKYSPPSSFAEKEFILFQTGDNPQYINPSFDDSSWNVVSLPFNWTKTFPEYTGIAWHRIHIKFPDKEPVKSVGVKFGIISDVDEFYFNGHLIGKTGNIAPPRISAYSTKRIYEIPAHLVNPGETNVIAVRMAGLFNDAAGAYRGKFSIGYFNKIQSDALAGDFFNVLFIVIYFAVSLYFGLLYLRHRIDKEFLFFSIFTFFTAFYLLLRTQASYFIVDDFFILKKTEYLSLVLVFPLFTEFLTHYFKQPRKLYLYLFYLISIINFVIILLSSDYLIWHKLLYYSIQPSWIIPVAMFIYLLMKEFKKDSDSKYIFVALCILLLTTINDIMLIRAVYNFIPLSNYGFMCLVIAFSVVIHNRYINLYKTVESMNQKKQASNIITEGNIKKIEQAKKIISRSFTTSLTREEIAESLEINPDYLGKIFKKHTGEKINDYINDLRVNEAARMLIETDKSIIDIAYAVGFESMSTFYRIFHKNIGESPINYREKNLK